MNRFFLIPIIIFISFITWCIIRGCSRENQEDEKEQDVIEIDSAYKIKPFLKNTIYIYNDDVSRASLIDYDYTPPQEYWLKEITVQIKDNIAIVSTDCEVVHKIISDEYYEFGGVKLAILKTDKGEVRIAEANGTLKKIYGFEIKYANFKVLTGISSMYCRLPEEKHLSIKNNTKNDTVASSNIIWFNDSIYYNFDTQKYDTIR